MAVLVGVIHFLAGLLGVVAILASGSVLSMLPFGIWDLLAFEGRGRLNLALPAAAGPAGVFVAGFVRTATVPHGEALPADLAAALLCVAGAGIIVALRARKSRRHCRYHPTRPLDEWSPVCPRCGLAVCGLPGCWVAERCRCHDCEWTKRALFPLNDAAWWQERFGARVEAGYCQRCRRPARDVMLYNCPKCLWPTCVRCWDEENGRCVRRDCNWVMPDLPPELQKCMGEMMARVPRPAQRVAPGPNLTS